MRGDGMIPAIIIYSWLAGIVSNILILTLNKPYEPHFLIGYILGGLCLGLWFWMIWHYREAISR